MKKMPETASQKLRSCASSRLDEAQPRVSKRNQGHPQHNRGALKRWVALKIHLASKKHNPIVSSFSSFSWTSKLSLPKGCA
jgi:hypothetical protein